MLVKGADRVTVRDALVRSFATALGAAEPSASPHPLGR
nr:hypothetical protein JVH1_3937 [Rhodococcus sp. JVH1]